MTNNKQKQTTHIRQRSSTSISLDVVIYVKYSHYKCINACIIIKDKMDKLVKRTHKAEIATLFFSPSNFDLSEFILFSAFGPFRVQIITHLFFFFPVW